MLLGLLLYSLRFRNIALSPTQTRSSSLRGAQLDAQLRNLAATHLDEIRRHQLDLNIHGTNFNSCNTVALSLAPA